MSFHKSVPSFFCKLQKFKLNILIDYKYTNISSDEKIIQKYKKQLFAYKFAIEKSIGKQIDEIYILNLKKIKIIKI